MEAPDNRDLIAALQAVFEAPEQNFRKVLETLIESTLIVGEDEEGFLTVETDEGELLALFTDVIELTLFEAGARWTTMSGEEVIRRVAADEIDGLVVNPAGKAFELSREDVLDFYEIDAS
jgi:hypothetical protein